MAIEAIPIPDGRHFGCDWIPATRSLVLRGGFMRTLSALIALAVLGGITPASALTSQPVQRLPSLLQVTVVPELVARRLGAPYRYRGPRQYRQYVTPQTRAAPMERVPQVAPLAPRVGN